MFPMGLGLLVASSVCLKAPDREEPHTKKQISESKFIIFCKVCMYVIYKNVHI